MHIVSDKCSPRLVRCFCSDREPRRAADPLGFYLGRGIEVVAGPSLLFSVEWVGESDSGGGARSVCLEPGRAVAKRLPARRGAGRVRKAYGVKFFSNMG